MAYRNQKKGPFCSRCASRRLKERDPVLYSFNALRGRALQRGKEFSLTLKWFRDFAAITGWIDYKGRHPEGLSIDRIDESRGYHPDNVQVIKLSENVKKFIAYNNVKSAWVALKKREISAHEFEMITGKLKT